MGGWRERETIYVGGIERNVEKEWIEGEKEREIEKTAEIG